MKTPKIERIDISPRLKMLEETTSIIPSISRILKRFSLIVITCRHKKIKIIDPKVNKAPLIFLNHAKA